MSASTQNGETTDSNGSDLEPAWDDPVASLRRRVLILKILSLVEAITYACMIPLMVNKYLLDGDQRIPYIALRVIAYFHGFLVIAFVVIAIDVHRALRWSKSFLALIVLTGPIGALICHLRLRRTVLPTEVDRRLFWF